MSYIPISQNNLTQISQEVCVPDYNRQQLKTGIVHIGVGGFHRSHQAYYIHKLLAKDKHLDWGICGIGLREADRQIYNILKKQDGLYTLIIQHPNGENQSEIIGSIKEFILATDTPHQAIDKMSHADTKIVSLTITEGGYNFHPTSGEFNFENQDIQFELEHPSQPKTVFGYLTAALKKRKENDLPSFSILSCDNIEHNGDVARKMVLTFAKRQNPELAEWIEENTTFPNTMVDRITPVTTDEAKEFLKKKHHMVDEWPVICEPFIQWVVEDKFANGRPPLEQLDVQFVKDVSPYEKMKIRLLNAGHSVLGLPGALHGHPMINSCMNDPIFAKFMRQFMDIEVTPTLDPIEGIDVDLYKSSLEERFANPNIKDAVSRICSESSAKLPKFLIPTLNDNLASGGSIKYATFILAVWCYYSDLERSEKDEPLDIYDTMKEELHAAAQNTQEDNLSFINQPLLFGDLLYNKRFTDQYTSCIRAIYKERNVRKLMNNLL